MSHADDEKDPRPEHDPARELEQILREMFGAGTPGSPRSADPDAPGPAIAFDPSQFAKFAGLPSDSAALAGMMETLRSALGNTTQDGGIDWSIARRTAISVASSGPTGSDPANALPAFGPASLWLDEVTEMGTPADAPRVLSRIEWVQQTIDTWISLAEPVAVSISETLMSAMRGQLPEELSTALAGADRMLTNVSGALFAMQLGQVVGNLAKEVLSAGDVGIPLLSGEGREGGALLPDNIEAFRAGLAQSESETMLYLAVRELAHARLFRHAKWLRLHLLSAIGEYAQGIEIDVLRIEDLAQDIDPTNPEQLQELMRNGSLIPPRTPRQEVAHARLETMLALIEGWVDVVTTEATHRLPAGDALGETIRRRRAAGGPAERAFSTLVGLELRPRRLREAAAMWRLVAERGGIAARDQLWAHPDLLPTAEEIEHPARLLERLGLAGAEPTPAEDEFDRELAALLDTEAEQGGDETDERE